MANPANTQYSPPDSPTNPSSDTEFAKLRTAYLDLLKMSLRNGLYEKPAADPTFADWLREPGRCWSNSKLSTVRSSQRCLCPLTMIEAPRWKDLA
jgi:hypothetical protein